MRLKKILSLAATLALLSSFLALPTSADQIFTAVLNSTTSRSVTYPTTGKQVASVDVSAASGSPDGTVQIYINDVSVGSGGAYATPTAKKTFRGPVADSITIALQLNTTGTVQISVTLK